MEDGQVTHLSPVESFALEVRRALEYEEFGVSKNTRRAYSSDAHQLAQWCRSHGIMLELPLEPTVVGAYLAFLADAGYALSTIKRRLAAISVMHRAARLENPTSDPHVEAVWRGIRRRVTRKKKRPSPLFFQELVTVLSRIEPDRLIDLRDRSLLLAGWAAGLRRSEISALELDDIERREEGIVLCLRKSKTDQEGKGRRVGVRKRQHSLCPVKALDAWLEAASVTDANVWRKLDRYNNIYPAGLSVEGINFIIKKRVSAAGLDPSCYSGHSLRSGLVVSARARGASEQSIMKITGHKSLSGLSHYLAVGSDFLEDPAGDAGLA